jgi:sortase B
MMIELNNRVFEMENKPTPERIFLYILGTAGIIATFFFARYVSYALGYSEPAQSQAMSETERLTATVEDAPTVAALLHEEIDAIYIKAKLTPEEIEQLRVAEAEKNRAKRAAGAKGGYISPINFEAIKAVNNDVYAWIMVAGTVVDYPILQHPTDNSRYLNYNIDGSYGRPGCIYTEIVNAKDFSDMNTVIYGHDMRNGSQFGQLQNFLKNNFFHEYQDIVIYLPDRELRYRIFAAYVFDDRHLMHDVNYNNPYMYANYLEEVFAIKGNQANFNKAVTVTTNDHIITLSTCVSENKKKRLLIQAVLTNPEDLWY